MTLIVKHSFVSAIADDPTAVAAGEVVPSNWNAVHTITGTLDAGSFATAPGIITLAMLANASANSLVGNVTGGSAARTDFTIDGLTLKATPAGSDEIIIWDVSGAAIKKATISSISTSSSARTQRSVTATPVVIAGSDQIINFNFVGAATCALPTAASRSGTPLTVKSINAAAPSLVFTPNGVETIDGAASFTMSIAKGEVTFVPFNDGVNTGWYIG